jgi:hypothetical protein
MAVVLGVFCCISILLASAGAGSRLASAGVYNQYHNYAGNSAQGNVMAGLSCAVCTIRVRCLQAGSVGGFVMATAAAAGQGPTVG